MNKIPNPKFVCDLANAKKQKDALKNIMNEIAINPSGPITLSTLEATGAIDFKTGKMLIPDSTTTFPLKNYLNLRDMFEFGVESEKQLGLDDLGISKKAMLDLFPEISKYLPYLIDDLPCWERLTLKNLPFVLFLLNFCSVVRASCKFPIPEVVPIPD